MRILKELQGNIIGQEDASKIGCSVQIAKSEEMGERLGLAAGRAIDEAGGWRTRQRVAGICRACQLLF